MKIAFTGNVFPFGEGMAYGGERILYYLIQGLSKLGHDIYLFSREGTKVPSRFVKDYVPVPALSNEHDVHYDKVSEYISRTKCDFDLYMCNYFGDGWNPEILERFLYAELTWCVWCHIFWQLRIPAYNTISYSNLMSDDFKRVGVDTTKIYYGLPEELYEFQPESDNYVVWIGKVEGGKAPDLAIKLAKAAGMKIILMAPPYNLGCFREKVLPYIDNKTVFWVRGVDDTQKKRIMSRAKAFISSNDNTWREHFGIVNIEALAMGVPIIGFNHIGYDCAIRTDSIIQDGQHGFILDYVDSSDVESILSKGVPFLQKINTIDRRECRKQFEDNFTSDLMARRYEWFFNQIYEKGQITSVEVPF